MLWWYLRQQVARYLDLLHGVAMRHYNANCFVLIVVRIMVGGECGNSGKCLQVWGFRTSDVNFSCCNMPMVFALLHMSIYGCETLSGGCEWLWDSTKTSLLLWEVHHLIWSMWEGVELLLSILEFKCGKPPPIAKPETTMWVCTEKVDWVLESLCNKGGKTNFLVTTYFSSTKPGNVGDLMLHAQIEVPQWDPGRSELFFGEKSPNGDTVFWKRNILS